LVELDGMLHVPGLPVVARDDELDLIAADASPGIREAISQPFLSVAISCRQPCELTSGKGLTACQVLPSSVRTQSLAA